MTLLQRIAAFITVLGVDIKARPPVVPSANFAGVATALNGRTTPCTVIVAVDETSLDVNGNPQKQTYWYDGAVLWYYSLTRADGTVTTAGSDSGLGLLPVADNAALLATGTVYRDTLIKVSSDASNSGSTGFYIKEATTGKINQIATNPIN